MKRNSLRFRICVAAFLLGVVLACLLALGTWFTAEEMEREFLTTTLREELDYFVAIHRADPRAQPPRSTTIRGYVVAPDAEASLPEHLRGLGPGIHEIRVGDTDLEVLVRDADGLRFFLSYDEARIERIESLLLVFLAAGAIGLVLLSLWLGWLASRRIIAPVALLADRVRSLEPGPGRSLADEFRGDTEIETLVEAFDEYRARLHAFVVRERELAADVSHQLRTSVAIIRSTLELVEDDPALPADARTSLGRLDRAADEMSRQIEAYLILAREPTAKEMRPCSVVATVHNVIDRELAAGAGGGVDIELELTADPRIAAVPLALDVVLGNLVHNAIVHGGPRVGIEVAVGSVTVTDSGPGIAPEDLPMIFERGYRATSDAPGSGLGLAIARRICERHGWAIELEAAPGRGTTARLRFGGSQPGVTPPTSRVAEAGTVGGDPGATGEVGGMAKDFVSS